MKKLQKRFAYNNNTVKAHYTCACYTQCPCASDGDEQANNQRMNTRYLYSAESASYN